MATKHVISFSSEVDFVLIALHSTHENYRIAFAINSLLPIYLTKKSSPKQLYIKNDIAHFEYFSYIDDSDDHGHYWELIHNKGLYENPPINQPAETGLFQEQQTDYSAFIIPEIKQADYLLKVRYELLNPELIAGQLDAHPLIQKAYVIDFDNVKSYQNLIE